MTKRLEEVLNLPEIQEIIDESTATFPLRIEEYDIKSEHQDNLFRNIKEFDKIAEALPQVKGLGDLTDKEFDELAARATSAYDDLMDLGMNVEPRFSGRIFEVASAMLKNAIDAKSSKVDKKLKIIELQIKKYKLDQDSKSSKEKEEEVTGEGYLVTDRNSLLEKLRKMK